MRDRMAAGIDDPVMGGEHHDQVRQIGERNAAGHSKGQWRKPRRNCRSPDHGRIVPRRRLPSA